MSAMDTGAGRLAFERGIHDRLPRKNAIPMRSQSAFVPTGAFAGRHAAPCEPVAWLGNRHILRAAGSCSGIIRAKTEAS